MAKPRVCAYCGEPISKNASPKAKYCSDSCRVRACRERRAKGIKPEPRPKAKPKAPILNQREFERMMDDSIEDVLRHTRDVLRRAMDDPDTRASDLPALSRQYIAVCRELDSQAGGGLFDETDETSEVSEDAGANVV
ncbi:hypothetical protein [Bifidobacterium tissieri]|uniref:hypothetical protein n=1 Tax=Bifidobacterium tissieri TaxID=1630162 RepID=UPI001238B330|nr:hypothetical protein [Bifidobacterium tissieri]KAA8832597.1 hypothetical protein EM849_03575 [Bifidobacterium tissieri]